MNREKAIISLKLKKVKLGLLFLYISADENIGRSFHRIGDYDIVAIFFGRGEETAYNVIHIFFST